MFCDNRFLSIFDASINFMRCFPLMIKKKTEKKGKKNKNAESMDQFCKFEGVVSQKLDFLCSNGVGLPNVLKNMFIMLFP